MTDNDSPAAAEEIALLKAKRSALEQAGTYVQSNTTMNNFQLVDDQVKSISAGVMEVTILEQKRYFENN